MGFWKFFPFLTLGTLFLYQAVFLQAAPLSEEEGGLLVDAPMKDHGKRMASWQKHETEDAASGTTQKKSCSFINCMIGKVADFLNKVANKNKSPENNALPESKRHRREDLQS